MRLVNIMKVKKVETICVDSNVVLRFLLSGDSVLSDSAKKIFKDAEDGKIKIYLDEVILAEVIWVLLSFYKMAKVEVCGRMAKLVVCRWIVNPRKELIVNALAIWSKTKLSYIDCWLFTFCRDSGFRMRTFDLALMRVVGEK